MDNLYDTIPAAVPNFKVDLDTLHGTELRQASVLKEVLGTGTILAQSIRTGETKVIEADNDTIKAFAATVNNGTLQVRDSRIVPKQNYSRVDLDAINIYAHKGPDENEGDGIVL